MKRKLVLPLLFASLCTLPARADFEPGRTRVSAEGDLRVTAAGGIYNGATHATVTEFYTDGKGITRYEVTVGTHTDSYDVEALTSQACGDQSYGRAEDTAPGRSELRLLRSNRKCRGVTSEWNLEVVTQSPEKGLLSTLRLEGNPDHFALADGNSNAK